jgi:hypothetical protein
MVFRQRVIQFRDYLICEHLDEDVAEAIITGTTNQQQPWKSSKIVVDEPEFRKVSSLISFSQVNMHKKTHTASCSKFGTKECRFNFPREIVETSRYDEQSGGIVSRRNNAWLNPCNLVLMYLLRCNHDIQLLSTSADAMALIYYITDYATETAAEVL